MRIAVLGSPNSWYVADLRRAAADRHEIIQVTFREISSHVLGDSNDGGVAVHSGPVALTQMDAVLVRTMPPGSLEQVVFRMDALAELERRGQKVINPPRGIEAAVDKYLATAKLRAAGLRVPETICCQTADDAMEAFRKLGGDAVVKPLFGGEGRGITRIEDEALALRAFKMLEQMDAVIYLQKFVAHEGFDLRLLIVGRCILAVRRRNPHDWRTNVSRGAKMDAVEMTEKLAETARTAAEAVGAPLCGVDLLPGPDGELYTLEVNAVPGWRALARALKVDVARLVLEMLEAAP